ncbi:MAG: MoxR family ATPase [Candidatus Competibacteraceae bacterium]
MTTLDNPELEHAWNTLQALRSEIGKAVIGQPVIIDQVLVALLAAGHVLIEGVPGLGKTLLGQALAKCIRGKFARIQFTADLMPSDITGHAIYNMRSESFEIRRGPVFCHLLLADEINRAPAKTQAALLEVMQEGQVTIEGQTFPLEPPFLVLATQNPIEQEGTYPLPEAQLDRFLLNIRIDYPAQQEEIALVQAVTLGQVGDRLDVSRLQPLLEPAAVLALQQAAARLAIDPQVLAYAVRIVATSRDFPGIAVGASPRGGIALVRAARAQALLEGRDFVTPDDIKAIAKAVLRHRLILAAAFEMEGRPVDQVIDDLLERVEAPRR